MGPNVNKWIGPVNANIHVSHSFKWVVHKLLALITRITTENQFLLFLNHNQTSLQRSLATANTFQFSKKIDSFNPFFQAFPRKTMCFYMMVDKFYIVF